MSRQERKPIVDPTPTDAPETVTGPVPAAETRTREVVAGPVTWEEMRALMRGGVPPEIPTRTWRPTTGGLLAILAGAWNLIFGLGAVFGGNILSNAVPNFNIGSTTGNTTTFGFGLGGYLIIIGLIAIIGGSFAVRRRLWPMALAGSIAAFFPSPLIITFIMGILSLIFVVLGHLEFYGTRISAQR